MQTSIDLSADIIDIRDIIERIEELARDLTTYIAESHAQPELVEEHATLCALMRKLAGEGGDEQWDGDWYPLTLIRDRYFLTYAQELAVDCGDYPKQVRWPYTCIDWEQAARELSYDYSSVNINGTDYFYR